MANAPRSEIDAILAQGRRDITALSQPAVDAFIRAFSTNLNLLIQRYTELEEQAKAGSKSADQLRRDLLPIKRQAEADFAYWQTVAGDALDDTVRASWASGVGMATRLVEAKQVAGAITPMFGTFNRLAYEAQYISTQAGPVRRLLSSIASDTTEKAVDVLRNAMMEGINPRKTAKRLMQAVSADLTRCETIARTESARAHKEGTLARYAEMEIGYVRWMSAEQMRTCPACWAMDGRVYAIDKVPNDHPNGRCVTEPMLDEEVEQARAQYGDDWGNSLWQENVTKNTGIMQKLTDDQLMHVFGSHKQIEAFRAGAPLQDAVKMVSNKTWGTSPSVQALKHPGTSPSAPTTKPPVTPKPPAATTKPVAPTVDWKHNLPDEWTPCDVKTAQQRISDMLSINDDVWGTVDNPSAIGSSWRESTKPTKGGAPRCFISPNIDEYDVQNIGKEILDYCKMLDDIGIKRPSYFNIGKKSKTANGSCGVGVCVNEGSFSTGIATEIRLVKDDLSGGVTFYDGDRYYRRTVKGKVEYRLLQKKVSPLNYKISDVSDSMLSVDDDTPQYIKTLHHEMGHYISFYNDGIDYPSTVLRRSEMLFNNGKNSSITEYSGSKQIERASENWASFVSYGRDHVSQRTAQLFDDLGWTKAAQKAGVIKWK